MTAEGAVDAASLQDTGMDGSVAPRSDTGSGTEGAPPAGDSAPPGRDAADGPERFACTGDEQCRDHGLVCDLVSGFCVGCLFDTDCLDRARCLDGECVDITPCENSLDCVDDPRGRVRCDEARGECVQCLTAAHCPDHHDCEDNACVPFVPCVSSLDCPPGMVCDTVWGRCLECVRDADCGKGMLCVASLCRRTCSSDDDCAPHGLLCDTDAGYCVECRLHEECGEALFCSLGNCVPDICRPGTGFCQENAVVICGEAGDGFAPPVPCTAGRSCLVTNGIASCEPRICDALGSRTCTPDRKKVIDCSPDGLAYVTVENCALNDEVCVVDRCLPVVCVPGQERCDGDDRVVICSSDGTAESTVNDCATDEYCDEDDPACEPQLCPPGQPVCDETENIAAICNARGTGYEDGGTDCDDTSEYCVDGACTVNECGKTVCPGASCVEIGSTCAYLVDLDGSRTRDDAVTACAALGKGWGLCTSKQICRTATHTYLADRGCDCSSGYDSCSNPAHANVYLHAADYRSSALWTRDIAYPSCFRTYGCDVADKVTTGAILCCHKKKR